MAQIPQVLGFELIIKVPSFGNQFQAGNVLKTNTKPVTLGGLHNEFWGEITFEEDKLHFCVKIKSTENKWPVWLEWGLEIRDPSKTSTRNLCSLNKEYVVGENDVGTTSPFTLMKSHRTIQRYTNCDVEFKWTVRLTTKEPFQCFTHLDDQLHQYQAMIITNKDYHHIEPKTEQFVSVDF